MAIYKRPGHYQNSYWLAIYKRRGQYENLYCLAFYKRILIRNIFRKLCIWWDLGVKQGCWVGTQQSFGEGNTRFYNAWPPCIIEKYNTWPPCIIKSHNARVSIKGFSSFFLLALQQVSLKKSLVLRRMLVYDAREVVGSVIICSRPKIVRMCTLLCLWFHNTVIRTD